MVATRSRCGASLTVCAVAALAVMTAAQTPAFSYTTVDFPGATLTSVFGINAGGEVVGIYRDAKRETHGFVRRGEMFVSIDFPGALATVARGISPSGDIVGSYRFAGEPEGNAHGYVFNRQGGFSKIDAPGHISTVAVRLLANGTIVGCFHDTEPMQMHGMRFAGNKVSGFDRGASMHTGATPDGKKIVGFYTDMGDVKRDRAYLLEGATFTPFDVPGSSASSAQDINPSGAIVGTYRDPAGKTHGFIREGSQFTTIDVPAATTTNAQGINPGGTVVGSFGDASGATHGFVANRKR